MNTRAKFICISVTKRQNWNKGQSPFMYDAEFQVVTGNSEENNRFFASTPSGTIKIGVIRDDHFEPGREYYVDFTDASFPVKATTEPS